MEPHSQSDIARLSYENKQAFRIQEAAHALGLGRTTLYKLSAQGKLPMIKAAGRTLILKKDLEDYLKSCADAA